MTFYALCGVQHDSLHCVVSRRVVIAGGTATVAVGATVGLHHAGAFEWIDIPPAREPDHADTAILAAARRRQAELADLSAQHDVPVVTRTLISALNSLGGRPGSDPDSTADKPNAGKPNADALVTELKEASAKCADDAVTAHSAALIRTLASLSAGLAQLAAFLEHPDE